MIYSVFAHYLPSFYFFNLILFIFTILYWFCHISKWICHRYTCVPHPEPSSLPIPSLWVVSVHQPQASSTKIKWIISPSREGVPASFGNDRLRKAHPLYFFCLLYWMWMWISTNLIQLNVIRINHIIWINPDNRITPAFADKGLSSQGYGFSSSHVLIWELDYKESWALKNWCFWTVVLEKTLEGPLDGKEIKPVNPKRNQSWIFIGRTDAEAETPILWPPETTNWLTAKEWRQEEKGTTEDEMVGWHHQLDRHEFEQAPGVGDGQGSLACCSPWDSKELDMTEQMNWTEQNNNTKHLLYSHELNIRLIGLLVMSCILTRIFINWSLLVLLMALSFFAFSGSI